MESQDRFRAYRENPTIEERNALVEEHLYMVDILIRKYLGKGVDYDDLYQVGALALVQAVERFDPDKGYEFSSFATPTILGEIKKYFRDKEWSLKVPRRMKEIAQKVQEVQDDLHLKLARKPTVAEIAEATGFHRSHVSNLIRKYFNEGLESVAAKHYSGNRRNMSIEEETAFLWQPGQCLQWDSGRISYH